MKKFATTISLLLYCLFGIMPNLSNAQTEPCGFGAAMQAEFQQNPAYATLIAQMEQNPGQGQGPTDGTYEIPTVVHIIHYAFLYHVWGQDWFFGGQDPCDNCHLPADCLDLGDRVCDTEACCTSLGTGNDCSPFLDACGPNWCNCQPSNPNSVYPKENYMSYNHSCQDQFTEGQAERMYTFALDNVRENLWSDENQRCTGIAGYYGENIVINSPSTPTNLDDSEPAQQRQHPHQRQPDHRGRLDLDNWGWCSGSLLR